MTNLDNIIAELKILGFVINPTLDQNCQIFLKVLGINHNFTVILVNGYEVKTLMLSGNSLQAAKVLENFKTAYLLGVSVGVFHVPEFSAS